MKVALFIDYDNLTPLQKEAGILDLVRKALFRLNYPEVTKKIDCDVRIYGGWYEGSAITKLAQNILVKIQSDFPAIIRVSNNNKILPVTANAELAMSLLEEPAHHIFDTYRKKKVHYNLRVKTPSAAGCTNSACSLPVLRRIIESNKCEMTGCNSIETEFIYRNEQKIIDTMLTCDLIYSKDLGYDQIAIISDDDDFIPPVRTLLLRGSKVIRFYPKLNRYRIPMTSFSNQLLEVNL